MNREPQALFGGEPVEVEAGELPRRCELAGQIATGFVGHSGGLRSGLLLRAHAARIPSLRQQPFKEVEALLRLGQLLSQLAHFAFQPFKPILEFAPTRALPPRTGPQTAP